MAVNLTSEENSNSEILIEKLPIRYDLKNIEKSKWKNVTELETVTFGKFFFSLYTHKT